MTRKRRFARNKYRALTKCPHKRGICLKVLTHAPKKPCSANRAVAKIAVRNKYRSRLFCFINGEETKIKTHKVQKFSVVLLRPGRVNDLPGVRYKLIRAAKRNKYPPGPLFIKQGSRSRHGVK
jgi:small subunit ribosomal protein S12